MTKRPLPAKGWQLATHHLARDAKLWIWIVVLLFITRFILVWQNRHGMDADTPFSTYALAFFTGFRFDMPVATICTVPVFLCSCLALIIPAHRAANTLRTVTTVLFAIVWVIITTVTLGYFGQFHNQFDAHFMGIIYDDRRAIFATIWKSYPVVPGILVMLVVCALVITLGRRWIRAPFPVPTPGAPATIISRITITLVLLLVVALGLRGSLGRRPMQRKDAARTTDLVLNRCIMNPFTALSYAIKSHRKLMRGDGIDHYFKKERIVAGIQEYSGNSEIDSIDDAFLRTAKGHAGRKPRHVFLLVMESYDGWTMLSRHAGWGVSTELRKLADDGIYVQRFLPGSRSTMTSLGAIISGMADAGVITNERAHPGDPPYASAIAAQMKTLGYQTHFYYAGYGSWQRIEDFSREQGFDFTHMGSSMDTDADTNEWGVSDKRLFSHIKSKFTPDKPTFNVILTSTNHPPYDLDLTKEGCPLTSVPAAYRDDYEHGNASIEMLGHHWYSDKWMGDFVRTISDRTPECLFAITGDHWGRTFPAPRPTQFEQAIVPLVLYGPDVLPKDIDEDQLSGSHYDLGATLIELAAEPGFVYHAIGRNILDPHPGEIAMSRLWFLGEDFILPTHGEQQVEALDGERLDSPPADLQAAKRHYMLTHGISWWRLSKGNEPPAQ